MRFVLKCALYAALLVAATGVRADDGGNGKRVWNDADGNRHVRFVLHPAPEPRPALKHRLITDPSTLTDRNAALYYLNAGGFFEQSRAQQEINDRIARWAEEADGNDYPPYSWIEQETPLEDIPLVEAKDFLRLVRFQERFMERAATAKYCDLENSLRDAMEEGKDPWMVLLPEVQSLRELARYQALRGRVALIEGRPEAAIDLMRQTNMLGHHLDQSDCLVNILVGVAIVGISNHSVLYDYQQQPDAPNLYWALAAMPNPIVDDSLAMATEARMVYGVMPGLKRVDEAMLPAEFWRTFVEQEQLFVLPKYDSNRIDVPDELFGIGYAITAYPQARRYLIEDWGMSEDRVDAYPIAQVVALAMARSYDEMSDAQMRWLHVPLWEMGDRPEGDLEEVARRAGPAAALGLMILPATTAARYATARVERDLAMHQAVEAIRMYGAENDGRLPQTLGDLPVPAPNDPSTGTPFNYQRHDHGTATLESVGPLHVDAIWHLRFAKDNEK